MKIRSSPVNGVHYGPLTSSCRGNPHLSFFGLFDTSVVIELCFQVIAHKILSWLNLPSVTKMKSIVASPSPNSLSLSLNYFCMPDKKMKKLYIFLFYGLYNHSC